MSIFTKLFKRKTTRLTSISNDHQLIVIDLSKVIIVKQEGLRIMVAFAGGGSMDIPFKNEEKTNEGMNHLIGKWSKL